MLPKPTLLTRGQIPDPIWNHHISQSQQCVIYALSWYLDTVCEQWQALVWPSATEFSIVMPLPVRQKLGIRVLYQPLFCQYLGIFSKHKLTAGQCSAFLQALEKHFPYISNYSFNPENNPPLREALTYFRCLEYEVSSTHWLKLDRCYAELHAGFSRDKKANLKRGLKANWEVVESDDFEALVTLFKENHAVGIGNIQAEAYRILLNVGQKCLKNGAGKLLYARAGSLVCAGIMLAHYGGRVIYLFNAADEAGRRDNARLVMLDAYLRENAGSNSVFDFESPGKRSIAGYYAGFGSAVMPFFAIRRNELPFPLRQIQRFRKWLLVKTRQYPCADLCRILDPFPASRF